MRNGIIQRERIDSAICLRRGPSVFRKTKVSFIRPRTVRFVKGPVETVAMRRIDVGGIGIGSVSVRVQIVGTQTTVAA